MSHDTTHDMIRGDVNGDGYADVLKKIDRSRQGYVLWFSLAAVVECSGLVGFALLADWSDRLHQLLAVMTVLIYGTVCLCLMSLFFYVRFWVLRVIKAIDLLPQRTDSKASSPTGPT